MKGKPRSIPQVTADEMTVLCVLARFPRSRSPRLRAIQQPLLDHAWPTMVSLKREAAGIALALIGHKPRSARIGAAANELRRRATSINARMGGTLPS